MSTRYMPDGWTLPRLTEANEVFFTAGQLKVQRCTACGTVQHPPDEVCKHCQAMEFEYIDARPTGVVESYTIVHHPVHPMLKERVPYNVVVVALDEHPGVHIVGNVIDVDPGDVHVGMAVECTFTEIPADGDRPAMHLPQWKAVGS